jgi:hypothetical protein
MEQASIDQIGSTIINGIADLAKRSFGSYLSEARQCGVETLQAMKVELERWTQELKSGKIDPDDLEDLVAGREDLIKLDALKQAGIAAIELDKLKAGIVNLVTKTLLAAI